MRQHTYKETMVDNINYYGLSAEFLADRSRLTWQFFSRTGFYL